MEARLIRGSERPMVAWKNGGGQTQELLCWPPGAGLERFRWRISVAQIERDGPFSIFAGYDRNLVLLDGVGMDLDFGSRLVRVDDQHRRIDFAGEEQLDCRLLAGPTRDFNLMVARGEAGVRLDSLRLDGDWAAQAGAVQLLALYLVNGEAQTSLGPMVAGDLLLGDALSVSGSGEALLLSLPV